MRNHKESEAERRAEAAARKVAEEKVAYELSARQAAEALAAQELAARQTAETEIARLRKELAQLKESKPKKKR